MNIKEHPVKLRWARICQTPLRSSQNNRNMTLIPGGRASLQWTQAGRLCINASMCHPATDRGTLAMNRQLPLEPRSLRGAAAQ